jgi:sulfate adenylyltransferase subunit 1
MAVEQTELLETDIEAYLKQHENKELLRFITCGSVDDGKSTLIGRLLHDSKMIFEDQLAAIHKDSKKHGTTGEEIDLALLVDGLQSEREQGITIDVAYRYFATDKRKFIIADTPGHEQYTRNMATGASTADLAIILIDARYGVQTQTRRHSYITSLLGIKNIVIAVNKMDLVDYSEERFNEIKAQYSEFAKELGIESPIFSPVSALTGDNVVNPSKNMPWFKDAPLMQLLDTIEIGDSTDLEHFRFPVQYVNRPHLDFRGFCGTIAAGQITVGDAITILPSMKTSTVKQVIQPAVSDDLMAVQTAFAPMAITLTLNDEVDISRGDMIVKSSDIPEVADHLEVMLVWMDEVAMRPGTDYLIKRATNVTTGRFSAIDYKVDVNTLEKSDAETLELNEIAQCQLSLNQMISFDPYSEIKGTGSFIIIDKYTNATLAAGMIVKKSQTTASKSTDREYTPFEQDLNALIRQHFPEWQCRSINDVLTAS